MSDSNIKKEIVVDFTEQIKKLEANKKAGYPPKCNEGYEVSEDGKTCVPVEESEAKKHKKENPFKKKGGDKKGGDKKGDDKKGGDKKGDKKGEEKEGGKNLPPWLKKKKK
jgi:hypothetical protein